MAVGRNVDIETKILLQLSSSTQKIDAKCFWRYRLAKIQDKDSGKNKSTDIPPINVPSEKQPFFIYQSQTNKKDQNQ